MKTKTRRRTVWLGGDEIVLLGAEPQAGTVIKRKFSIPPARGCKAPLTEKDFKTGVLILSTLPNIHKHACVSQILDLEEKVPASFSQARVVHVSADPQENWCEMDEYHPDVKSPSYTLASADSESRQAFVETFGVAVDKHWRIAHGLFAIKDGVILISDIPQNQMQTPWVKGFLRKLETKVGSS